jgi:virginiamycin B lyase
VVVRYALRGLAVLAASLLPCAPAAAHDVTGQPLPGEAAASTGGHVYWADQSGNSIGRAHVDGSSVEPRFITGATTPRAVAVAGPRLYWAHGGSPGSIGFAGRDGSAPNQSFVSTAGAPTGVAVDSGAVYWTHTVSGAGKIGRVGHAGLGANQSSGSTAASPCGIAADFDKLYWGNGGTNAIGRSHGPFSIVQNFITGAATPCGVAATETHVYWANRSGGSIGRAVIDGSGVNNSFVPANRPCGVAVDATHVYWSSTAGTIGRARLDGSAVEQTFVRGAGEPCGIAVDPTVAPRPAVHSFPPARVRGQGEIKDFFVANTSSSALDVSSVTVVGEDPREFVKTGDSCVTSLIAAGGGCHLNARFRPRANGRRRAVIRITSDATNSPTDILVFGRGDGRAPKIRRAAVKRATLRYSLNETARVAVTVTGRARKGRRLRRIGRFSQRGKVGRNRKRFPQRIRRRLRPGRYRVTLRARDTVGNRARRTIRFRVRR